MYCVTFQLKIYYTHLTMNYAMRFLPSPTKRAHNFYHSLSRTAHSHCHKEVCVHVDYEYILGSLIFLSYKTKNTKLEKLVQNAPDCKILIGNLMLHYRCSRTNRI